MLQKGHKYKVQIKDASEFHEDLKFKNWQEVQVVFIKQMPFQWSMCRLDWTDQGQNFDEENSKLVWVMPLINPKLNDKYFICKTNAVALAVQKDLLKQWLRFIAWQDKPEKNIAKVEDYKNWVIIITRWDSIFFIELNEENLKRIKEDWLTNFYSKGKNSDKEVWHMKEDKEEDTIEKWNLTKEEFKWILGVLSKIFK